MESHPNRSARSRSASCTPPTADAIREARDRAGLTQDQAAALVCCTGRAWRLWEAGERTMHSATWRLFRILTNQLD